MTQPTPTTPTQVRHPWRATARTAAAATVGMLPILPILAAELGVETVPAVAGVLTLAAGVTRALAIPAVNAWVHRWLPWLAAQPPAASP